MEEKRLRFFFHHDLLYDSLKNFLVLEVGAFYYLKNPAKNGVLTGDMFRMIKSSTGKAPISQ